MKISLGQPFSKESVSVGNMHMNKQSLAASRVLDLLMPAKDVKMCKDTTKTHTHYTHTHTHTPAKSITNLTIYVGSLWVEIA